ncbi:ferritin like protein 1 [Haemophilus influenzae F3031]|nr:ferritin like protein 1 [Haemophilus influenzae F3031]
MIATNYALLHFINQNGKELVMLNQIIINKLNDQINLEFYSSNVYLQMSAWCSKHGYEGAATFLLRHADEELEHMQKLFNYVSETSGMPILGKIDAPKHDYSSLREVFEITLEHEKLVTSKINELVEVTFESKDYSTFNFLQWYVAEQHEEEKLFSGIIDRFNLVGEDGKGLFFIDRELATLE